MVKSSIYYTSLLMWYELFPPEQILLLESDDLRYKPYQTMLKMEEFLKIDHIIRPAQFQYDETKKFYCFRIDGVLECLPACKGLKPPSIDPACIKKLTDFFEESNRNLFDLIGKQYDW